MINIFILILLTKCNPGSFNILIVIYLCIHENGPRETA